MAEPESPEWLEEWRQRKRSIDPDAVTRALEPFGVVRRTTKEIARSLEPAVVYVFVSGEQRERSRTAKAITRRGGRVVSYSDALRETDSHIDWMRLSMAWSVIRASVSTAVQSGMPVVVDAMVSQKDMQAFSQYCFLSGARGVVALCLTTDYEEGWDDDGFTGVIWIV